MRKFTILAILMLSVAMPAFAADPVDAVAKRPVCQEKMVPYVTLAYDGRTTAKSDVAGDVLRAKDAEIRALATAAGITHIDSIGSSYTVHNKNNSAGMTCAGTPIEFKPGEAMVQVKTNYELAPMGKVSPFIDLLIDKGFVPTVNEMKRTVCE